MEWSRVLIYLRHSFRLGAITNPIYRHACATCPELTSSISTMMKGTYKGWQIRLLKSKLYIFYWSCCSKFVSTLATFYIYFNTLFFYAFSLVMMLFTVQPFREWAAPTWFSKPSDPTSFPLSGPLVDPLCHYRVYWTPLGPTQWSLSLTFNEAITAFFFTQSSYWIWK